MTVHLLKYTIEKAQYIKKDILCNITNIIILSKFTILEYY